MSFQSIPKAVSIDFEKIIDNLPKDLTPSNLVAYAMGYQEGFHSVNIGDGVTWEQMSYSKLSFSKFIRKAAGCRTSAPEYKELYRFLLKCFVDADKDFDGKIELSEFSVMIDAAASAPRKWGFAPTSRELYGGGGSGESSFKQKANAARTKMFEVMANGGDFLSFDVWLTFCYDHICKKVLEMEREGMTTNIPQYEWSREDFATFIKAATATTHSAEYKELYDFLLKCFVQADTNHDGTVGPSEFDTMIELASSAPRRFGFAPSSSILFSGDDERRKARAQMLLAMDTDKSGSISFDEWLSFCYGHICEKAKEL